MLIDSRIVVLRDTLIFVVYYKLIFWIIANYYVHEHSAEKGDSIVDVPGLHDRRARFAADNVCGIVRLMDRNRQSGESRSQVLHIFGAVDARTLGKARVYFGRLDKAVRRDNHRVAKMTVVRRGAIEPEIG